VFFKKKVKNQKHPWGPTGTPPGILRYKSGMLLFLLFLGSERCKFEKWPAENAQKMTLFRCWMSVIWVTWKMSWANLLKLCFLGFWNYNSVIQALLASNVLCLFI